MSNSMDSVNRRISGNHDVLRDTLEIASHESDEYSRQANGVLALMDRFSVYFGITIFFLHH